MELRLVPSCEYPQEAAALFGAYTDLQTAIDMYKNLGFYEIPSYNNSPMEGLVCLKLEL